PPQRAARRGGQRPQGRPRDGRGEGALRARHDQARRDLRPALARAALNALLAAAAPLLANAFVVWGAPVTWLEIVAFVLSVAMVALNIRVDPLGWPLAIVSSLLYMLLFRSSRLYGDASLQVFFPV